MYRADDCLCLTLHRIPPFPRIASLFIYNALYIYIDIQQTSMSKILARFKRAASTSSDDQPLPSSPRRSASASDFDDEDDESHTVLSSNSLSPSGRTTLSGSHFIEEFGDGKQPPLSPLNARTAAYPGGTLTPSPSKRSGLEFPESASKPLGTPKLTLTNPEAHSPSSLLSSPGKDSPAQLRSEGLGLGISTHPQTDTNGARTVSLTLSQAARRLTLTS